MRMLIVLLALALILMGCGAKEKPTLPSSTKVGAVILKENDTYKLYVIFTLPNPCHKIVYRGMSIYSDKIIVHYEYFPPKPDTVCIQKLEVYNTTVNLGNLKKGEYTIYIYVNDRIVKKLRFNVK